MKTQARVRSEASSTGAKVFGLVVAACLCVLAIALTTKIVMVLFS